MPNHFSDQFLTAGNWPERTSVAADVIRILPVKSVWDFGCGWGHLKSMIPQEWVGVDTVPQPGKNILVLDLNVFRPEIYLNKEDSMAVGLGLLEYLDDVNSFTSWVSNHFGTALFSYTVNEGHSISYRRNWKNHYSESEICQIWSRYFPRLEIIGRCYTYQILALMQH